MQFKRIIPREELRHWIECFWIAQNGDPSPIIQKIIPDGFPEIIFHFADPYLINLRGDWEPQSKNLLAGQITRYFHLKNTGRSHMLGIKLKPASLAQLFDLSMDSLTDKVVELNSQLDSFHTLTDRIHAAPADDTRIELIQDEFIKRIKPTSSGPIDKALEVLFSKQGNVSVAHLSEAASVSERQLERLFKKYIGLPPKFYARIIRFSYIFQNAQEGKMSWSELGLETGFYDQSHFIRNFKAFTGEDPSKYFFDQPSLANFFMKK
jgi:AraC-like DNA-binding protein